MKNVLLGLVVATATIFVAGCGKSGTATDTTGSETGTEPEQESAIEEIVETVTGAKQIKAGKKAEEHFSAKSDLARSEDNEHLDEMDLCRGDLLHTSIMRQARKTSTRSRHICQRGGSGKDRRMRNLFFS